MKKNDIKKGVDDLYTRYAHTLEMLEKAVDKIDQLQEELDKKPKEVIVEKVVEKEIEIIKEIPIEKIVEKIVEVVKEVEVPKETVVTIEKEVPGPERIVEVPGPERRVEVPGPERVVVRTDNSKLDKLSSDNKTLKHLVLDLQQQLDKKPKEVEKIVEVERIVEKPVEVEKAATGDLKEAARIMASSELNKEDLSEEEIFNLLQKSSEEDVRKKIGFWAQPLPTDTDQSSNKIYISKK